MKKYVFSFVFVISAVKVSAQFYNPYFNPYMGEVQTDIQMRLAENAQLAQMRAQTMAMQMQTMQILQARAAAATYNLMNFQWNPTKLPEPDPTPIVVTSREKVPCSTCGETGWVTRNKPNYALKRMVTVRERCSECHGKGYNRE